MLVNLGPRTSTCKTSSLASERTCFRAAGSRGARRTRSSLRVDGFDNALAVIPDLGLEKECEFVLGRASSYGYRVIL